MRIAVFGLGYVGCVSAACLADAGHEVVGVDLNSTKTEAIRSGRSPVVEPGLDDMIARVVADGRLRVAADARDAVASTELALVCVGTPSAANGSLDVKHVERVTHEIGEAILAGNAARYTVVFRSTMLPGTVEGRLLPILSAAAKRGVGPALGVAVNPEFLREGSAIADFRAPPKTVIGVNDPATGDEVCAIYATVPGPKECVPIRVAELVKYADNSFHAVKVAFANEIGNVAKSAGVDSHEVMRIFCQDTKLNLSPVYLKPGFAFGGSCLPKDLRALIHFARRQDVGVPLLEGAVASNEEQKRVALRAVARAGTKRVGILGLAFKAGTDDLRESPMVELVEILLGRGYDLRIFDRNVAIARLVGANRNYIEEEIPHIDRLMVQTPEEVMAHAELVVVGNADPAFGALIAQAGPKQRVLDLVRVNTEPISHSGYDGLSW